MWLIPGKFLRDRVTSLTTLDKLSKIESRRADLLAKFLDISHRDTLLRLTYELGKVHHDWLDIKQKKFEQTAGALEPRLLQKMAFICFQGIRYLHKHLLTWGQKEAQEPVSIEAIVEGARNFNSNSKVLFEMPQRLPNHDAKMVLEVIYGLARFYNKVFTPISADQAGFTRMAILHYQHMVAYCHRNRDHLVLITSEYNSAVHTTDMLQRQLNMQQAAIKDNNP